MTTDRLNDRQIRLTKVRESEYLLSDGQGLFLRVRPKGGKDWLFIYSFSGKRRKMGMGSLNDVPLVTARKERDKARDALAQQIDPQIQHRINEAQQDAQRQALVAMSARLTVQELFERWERVEISARKDGGKEIRRCFEKDVLPKLGSIAAEDVKRAHVAAILDKVVERGARILARNLLGALRQMFGFAIKRELAENDPTSHLKRNDYGAKIDRERVLSEAEIKTLWQALPAAKMGKRNELAIWIQLATGCRIGELMQARKEHINLVKGTWRIPPEVSKNAREHTISLSTFAADSFAELLDLNDSQWVMPARKLDCHVYMKTITKLVADRQRGDKEAMCNRSPHIKALILPGGKWTPHDLRRTAATMMVQLGVAPDVVERCLNHIEQNRMKRIYQRHDYAAEMKQGWQVLGERLELLTRTDTANVLLLARSTA